MILIRQLMSLFILATLCLYGMLDWHETTSEQDYMLIIVINHTQTVSMIKKKSDSDSFTEQLLL